MKLRGRGIGAGMVLGTAAIVKTRNGVALMPQVPMQIAEQIAARKLTEKPEIILVAESYDAALALADTIEWGTVIGIAATVAGSAVSAFGLPCVVEIPDLLARLPDDALLILDAERGFVSINPDFTEIAQFQSEKENLNPRKRYFLDNVHQSATTRDGQTIQIFQQICTEEKVVQAVQQGADGIFCNLALIKSISDNDDILPISVTMGNIVHELAGKPVIVDDDFNLPPEVLLFAATRGELIAAERLQAIDDLWEFQRELHETQNRLLESNDPNQLPLLAALFEIDDLVDSNLRSSLEEYTDAGISRIVVDASSLPLPDSLAVLEPFAASIRDLLLPVYVIAHPRSVAEYDFDPDYAKTKMLEWLVGAGVTGIIVEGDIQEYKAQVRQIRHEECRAEVLSLLSPPQ